MPRQESNLQLRRSERRLRTGTECSAVPEEIEDSLLRYRPGPSSLLLVCRLPCAVCSRLAVPTGVAPVTSALTRRRLHDFGLETLWQAASNKQRDPLLCCCLPDALCCLLFVGAPCGNRTRITGLEDRGSALELRTPVFGFTLAPAGRGQSNAVRAPSAHGVSGLIVKNAPRRAPGRTRWRRAEPTKKNPRPFERGVWWFRLQVCLGRTPALVLLIRAGQANRHRSLIWGGWQAAHIGGHHTHHAPLNRGGGERFAGIACGNQFPAGAGGRARKPTTKTANTAARPRQGTSQIERHSGTPPTV
jgi:hypothetical protein